MEGRERKKKPTDIKLEGITPHTPSRKFNPTVMNQKTPRKPFLLAVSHHTHHFNMTE